MRRIPTFLLGAALLAAKPAMGADGNPIDVGRSVFLRSSCVLCHTIRGTSAAGRMGPDLTHVASRRLLAAGTIVNNTGNLSGWILNPQNVKPGAKMPPTLLPGEDLRALVVYLQSLR